MQRSETIVKLAPALNRAQAAVKPVSKNKTNPHFRNNYADLGAVWDACRDALAANELSVLQLPTAAEPGYCGLETILLHVSGEFISSTAQIPLGKNEPQGYGSALTYLRRYSLAALLGIVADDDDDASAAQPPRGASHHPQQRRPEPAPAPRQADADPHAELRRRAAEVTGKPLESIRPVNPDVLRRWIDQAQEQTA
jgi:hypothetical protein